MYGIVILLDVASQSLQLDKLVKKRKRLLSSHIDRLCVRCILWLWAMWLEHIMSVGDNRRRLSNKNSHRPSCSKINSNTSGQFYACVQTNTAELFIADHLQINLPLCCCAYEPVDEVLG